MSGVGIMGVGIPNAFNPPESELKVGAKPRFGKNSLLGRAKLRRLQKQILPYRGFKGVFPNFYWKNFLRLLQFRCKLAYLCRAFLESRSDPVAQSVEHLTFNQGVMGSSPIGITLHLDKSLYLNGLQGLFYWRCRLRCRFALFWSFRIGFSAYWHTFGRASYWKKLPVTLSPDLSTIKPCTL